MKRLLLPIALIVLAACGSPQDTPTPGPQNLQTRIAATMAAIPTAESLTPNAPTATSAPAQPAATEPRQPATEAPSQPATEQEYTVQVGDTLSTIAVKFNTSIAAIQLVNRLDDVRVVRLGQKLKIPTSKLAPDEGPYWIVHVVQAGESLSTIAVRYNVTLEDLVRINNITNTGLTRVGDRLVIPAKGPVA